MAYERKPDPLKQFDRILALEAMAEVGTSKDIDRLADLNLHGDPRYDKYIIRFRDRALMILQCRLWRD